jgi:Lon protease-like protein
MVRLIRLTSRGNGRSGIAVGGACTVDVESCRVRDNGYAQLLTLPWSETHLRQSEFLSNTAPAWVDHGGRVFRDDEELHGGLDEFK